MTDIPDYRVAFDLVSVGYRAWWFPLSGLIFIGIGSGILLVPRLLGIRPSTYTKAIAVFIVGFATLWTCVSFIGTYGEYRRLVHAYHAGTYEVLEGVVEGFEPMPFTGHQDESFTLKGVKFRYSDYQVMAGFNNTTSHGGPIREGRRIRLWHVGNAIIRLEVDDPLMRRDHAHNLTVRPVTQLAGMHFRRRGTDVSRAHP